MSLRVHGGPFFQGYFRGLFQTVSNLGFFYQHGFPKRYYALSKYKARKNFCELFRKNTLSKLEPLRPIVNGEEKHIYPKVGDLIIFPSVMNHRVPMSQTDDERIVVVGNIR